MTTATLTAPKPAKVRKPRPKPARSLSIVHQEAETLIVGITVGKTFAHYFITPLASDFGTAFTVEKQSEAGTETTETYSVNVNGTEQMCDCRGFGRHSHCKHVDAVRKLQELCVLPAAQPMPEEPGRVEVWDSSEW
jgi:hypothetical protein